MLSWILNSWVALLLIVSIPIILFGVSTNVTKRRNKDMKKNPYDPGIIPHRPLDIKNLN